MTHSFKNYIAVLSMLLGLTIWAVPAHAQEEEERACYSRTELVDELISEHGEQLLKVYNIKNRGVLEFHVNISLGTWTAIITDELYESCVVGVGAGLLIKSRL